MPSAGQPLIAAIERHPRAVLAGFLGFHTLLWTALPATLYANLPLDLIEALTYGREWQLGYDKLPPLPWWLVEIVHRAIGSDFAYYLTAQVAVAATFLAVFALGRDLVGAPRALLALLIIDGQHYLNYTAVKFNHDVIQLPFWALAGLALHRALRGGGVWYWTLLGFAIGISLWAKYFVVILVAPLGLFLLFDRDARAHWRTPGPYIAIAIALLVMAPHVVWLLANDFLPFAYANRRAAPSRGLIDHVLHPLTFVASQLFFLLPALAISLPLAWRTHRKELVAATGFDRRLVTLLAFGPMAAMFALSVASGRGAIAMWGYPLWLFLSIWQMVELKPAFDRTLVAAVGGVWAAVTAALAIAFVVNYAVLPSVDQRYRAVDFPGQALAARIAEGFRTATGEPLRYVIADMWEGGNIAHYAPEQPRVLIDGDPARAPWIDLGDLKRHGAAVVWTGPDEKPNDVPPGFRLVAPGALVQPPFALPFRRGPLVLHVHWAIVPPAR